MIYYQKALKNLIDELLTANTHNVLFDVNLYNDIASDDFNEESRIDNTYKTELKRQVPTMITNIQGEYIPIPNLNGTNNNVEIIFDLAIDDMTGTEREDEFATVNYNNTLSAIDEFKNSLLANYFPLGNVNMFMGGEDSTIVSTGSVIFAPAFIYIKFTPKDTETEGILRAESTDYNKLYKDATHIVFDIDGTNLIKAPYTVNEEITITVNKTSGNLWTISNGVDTPETYTSATASNYRIFTMGYTTGLNSILSELVIDNDYYASLVDVVSPLINFVDFDDKDVITNSGEDTRTTVVNNCILFGSDGNAVFQVYPLAVVGNYTAENGINYHSFSLQLEAMVGDNFIFGNNFEYYINDTQVYPVDRNHTFALDTQGRQGINENVMTFIGSESSLDWTQSFFYQPTALLTSLMKKITTGDTAQNTIYTIKVQYPFWNKEYSVVIEGGGVNTDINSITTFTLQFKLADDVIIP